MHPENRVFSRTRFDITKLPPKNWCNRSSEKIPCGGKQIPEPGSSNFCLRNCIIIYIASTIINSENKMSHHGHSHNNCCEHEHDHDPESGVDDGWSLYKYVLRTTKFIITNPQSTDILILNN